ncbi:S-adenosyl-L-methionine-dependent methyltransferase [Aspergillus undulatus]|uniref:S-adenosyl-L-methionine-dependent methyltransferase n=1 Tax=Aspergillus undulatus TaxID=1810928 RepID=UPI003CCDEB0C
MDNLTLKQRAAGIFQTANSLADELAATGHPEPTFQHGLSPHLYGDAPQSTARDLKQQLLRMVDELRALLTEPAALLAPEMNSFPTLSVHPLVRLGIAENFPDQGSSVSGLARSLHLREDVVRRLLKHSAAHHIFYEAEPDFYIHTAASRHLSQNKGMRDWVFVGAEEVLPGLLKIADALEQYPGSEEPEHCGWNIAHNIADPAFKALARMPERAAKIAGTMNWQIQTPGFSPHYLAEAFPWERKDTNCENGDPNPELTIVDVGGGLGHISRALAAYSSSNVSIPPAKFIVQDMPDIVAAGEALLPAPLKDRVRFQAHDFFTPQPASLHGADVYLLRSVLHDWSDKYAAMILRSLTPALKKGSIVLINERVVPGFREAHYLVERPLREFDLIMMSFQNARERTRDDWERLIAAADGRFWLTDVRQQEGSSLAVIEVTWMG